MAKGYWIGHVDVSNAENYPNYMKAAQPAYEKYGAKFIVRGGKFDSVEGKARSRHVVVEFESYEKALACYNSPEYQAAAKIRQANSEGDILIVEGAE
ncbi:DUF1330 domain-containing protein [Hyphococcus flavus]|uniref:DUF1330 domain-containing protein n=1 Tax=Hyphococcus flavus TaxID=1866326 RepID=A0AAF0CE34_9PROT|nr:DUF1330 domain-containing protein [Hyphococcus flavus]WDI30611.1 DUF1330 domain-containing protein [Hyphococcus flavus]